MRHNKKIFYMAINTISVNMTINIISVHNMAINIISVPNMAINIISVHMAINIISVHLAMNTISVHMAINTISVQCNGGFIPDITCNTLATIGQ